MRVRWWPWWYIVTKGIFGEEKEVRQACRRDVEEVREEAELARRRTESTVVTAVTATLDLDGNNHILRASPPPPRDHTQRFNPTPQTRRVSVQSVTPRFHRAATSSDPSHDHYCAASQRHVRSVSAMADDSINAYAILDAIPSESLHSVSTSPTTP